ncbi:MAG: hypothetical protein EHM47_15095, partial [Ignavibacteriales bacterium]
MIKVLEICYKGIRFSSHKNRFQFCIPYTFIPLYLYTLLLIISSSAEIHSQTEIEEQFNLAKKYYEEENYFDAVTEFKRLLFFSVRDVYDYESNMLIGLSYKSGARFSEAIQYFSLAEISSKSVDDIFEARIEIIKVNILRRTIERAFVLLDSLQNDSSFSSRVDELN